MGARFRHAAGRVTFEPPAQYAWKPATQLFPTADPWTFTAPNLQYLMDSPTELSDYTLRSFTVHNPDGKEFTIRTAVHHDGDPSVIDEYAAGAEKIVNEAAAVFGEFPAFDTGTYTFLGDYVPWGGGDGMEHRNSTVVASATSFKNPQAVHGGARNAVSRVLPLLERRADPSEDRSSRSTSKTPTSPESCGWPRASRSTTVRSSWCGRAWRSRIPRAS